MSNEANNPNEVQGQEASDAERREGYLDELKTRFVILPTAILLDRQAGKLTPQDIYFYCYLLAKQGRNDCLWWGYDSLELITGLTESVMKKSVERLLACGHIKRTRQRDGASRTYCQTRVTKTREVFVRGVKVADATKELDASPVATPIQNRLAGSPADRNSFERSSGAQTESSLN